MPYNAIYPGSINGNLQMKMYDSFLSNLPITDLGCLLLSSRRGGSNESLS